MGCEEKKATWGVESGPTSGPRCSTLAPDRLPAAMADATAIRRLPDRASKEQGSNNVADRRRWPSCSWVWLYR